MGKMLAGLGPWAGAPGGGLKVCEGRRAWNSRAASHSQRPGQIESKPLTLTLVQRIEESEAPSLSDLPHAIVPFSNGDKEL